MHVHIIGICGTFMAGIAGIAKSLGYTVTGCDENVYPPMSLQLEALGIDIDKGFHLSDNQKKANKIIVGNIGKRGMPAIEALLDLKQDFISAPAWLYQEVLRHKTVLAVTGTHGKTTTSALLAWILEASGKNPSFLVGGQVPGFGVSARLTDSPYFVIEADEYDTALFDKRAKFVHYYPRHCLINNLEFDHADIYEDLKAIQKSFHHLLKIIPQSGSVIVPSVDKAIDEVLDKGVWSNVLRIDKDIKISSHSKDYANFTVDFLGQSYDVNSPLLGKHNAHNALGALLLAHQASVDMLSATKAIASFKGVKRRLEKVAFSNHQVFYDDFAHHPTAVSVTLDALRQHVGNESIMAFFELGSNSLKAGVHLEALLDAFSMSDDAYLYCELEGEKRSQLAEKIKGKMPLLLSQNEIIHKILEKQQKMKHVIFMSNKNLYGKLKPLFLSQKQLKLKVP